MEYKNRYFIGDMSKICNLSKKALRYYDKINLIPSHRHDYNNYRYYTYDALLTVPVIKYYKQMGFTLDEMKEFIEGSGTNVFKSIQKSFLTKIHELEEEQEKIRRKHVSVRDWYELILEAEMAIDNDIRDVSIKFIDSADLLFQDQIYKNDIRDSIINLEFTKHVEDLNNEITGPVIINFSSIDDRLENNEQEIKMLQKTILSCSDENTYRFGGEMMASCYHIGPHESIHSTYDKMRRWAVNNAYNLSKQSYERYVTDYWTTRNDAKFVTEVLIKASRSGSV
ncbi:MerR family transcriptional regulator [Maridesulfovibrio zosterae]|uniref:MerR family transcriptional regulator n=1 Tax=Maridesulfovibrio zosterae TaxID=82171 RepID=UPI00042858F0|nr:MerR family DNA-binding transcriptional regulator [Maridesulfovibrio zosterae]